MEYTVIIEESENNYGAWVPDLPGCVTTGPTVAETLSNIRDAIEFHLAGMREDGEPIPEPKT
jgi:predicted RNase H-like HicB family nuclease